MGSCTELSSTQLVRNMAINRTIAASCTFNENGARLFIPIARHLPDVLKIAHFTGFSIGGR